MYVTHSKVLADPPIPVQLFPTVNIAFRENRPDTVGRHPLPRPAVYQHTVRVIFYTSGITLRC